MMQLWTEALVSALSTAHTRDLHTCPCIAGMYCVLIYEGHSQRRRSSILRLPYTGTLTAAETYLVGAAWQHYLTEVLAC
jgi:hypothetical protein